MNDCLPDSITVDVPLGGRVLVVANLHLTATTTPASAQATAAVVRAVDAWGGPGVLVVNGGLFDTGVDVNDALTAHPQLTATVSAFAAGPGRRVLVLPGARDAELAWPERPGAGHSTAGARRCLAERLGAAVAIAADLDLHTGTGDQRIRVEPGHRFDELAARTDPRNPAETPLSVHLRDEVVGRARREQASGRGTTGWLAGLDALDDPAAFPHFLASRLVYRRLGRFAWLLLLPFVAALVLRVPVLLWRKAHRGIGAVGPDALFAAGTLIGIAILAILVILAVRRTWNALAGITVGADRSDPNAGVRTAARSLVTEGCRGLVTAHTGRAELTPLGEGFYANAGCAGEIVSEVPSRAPGLNLPSVFLPSEQISWLELEAGSDVHARLVHGRRQLPGATWLERLAARRVAERPGTDLHVEVVATFPGDAAWPSAPEDDRRRKRVRRAASLFVALAGFVSLVSAVSDPLRDHLHAVQRVVPIAVPELAGALAALGGVGLLVLARGIRRGQRRAWLICQVVLVAVAVAHLVRGVDIEEAVVALAAATFLWINRRSFQASSDLPRLRRGVFTVLGAAVVATVAGAIGVEAGFRFTGAAYPGRHHLPWLQAFQASAERLVGVQHVVVSPGVDRFFSPAMGTVGVGLGLALAWLLLRPVVRHRAGSARGAVVSGGAVAGRPAGGRPAGGLWPAGGRVASAVVGTRRRWPGPGRWWPATVRGRSTTSPCARTRTTSSGATSVVAFGVYNGTCLVSPDPVGPPAEREAVWRAFRSFVDGHGWALGVLGAGEEWLPVYRDTGMHDLYVGDEGVVRTNRFSLQGGKFKGLRQAVNRVANYGYTISFHDPASLDADLRAELLDVMTKSRRGDVERGFSMTLGRVFEPEDRGLLLAVVHGPPEERRRLRIAARWWRSASTFPPRASAGTRSTSCGATTATIPTG